MSKVIVENFSVGLVDDHPIVREGLANVIRRIPQARVSFSCGTPEEALTYLRREPVDVVLLDLCLAGDDGLTWLNRFRSTSPELKVLMLTVSDEEVSLLAAMRGGACGYLLKDSECEQILAAIECARHGIASVSPANLLPGLFQKGGSEPGVLQERQARTLTAREKQILTLVASGHGNKQIGQKLGLAETTIKKYCYNAMTKLSSRSREAAAMTALRLGLIDLESD